MTERELLGEAGIDSTIGEDWTSSEVGAAVTDYLDMLLAELASEPYSKASHRRALLAVLRPGRTQAAVEFKHANISAVMLELGLPYIRGYKPRGNYQAALASEIQSRLAEDKNLLPRLRGGVALSPDTPLEPAPASRSRTPGRARRGRIIDYEALQAENRRLGTLGERLVFEFEQARLRTADRADLARTVRWSARDDGDGLGYDVLSFGVDGAPRHIEVKTTALGPETPFYLSASELAFAALHPESFGLYRVYNVGDRPRFFSIQGDLTAELELTAVTFRARLR